MLRRGADAWNAWRSGHPRTQPFLYRADLSELRVVWQFSTRTFVRVILHHLDLHREPALYRPEPGLQPPPGRQRELFTQLLFSYKVNPQTVLFLGYSDTRLGEDGLDLALRDRTAFLKLGYAWLP